MEIIPISTERVDINPKGTLQEWIEESLSKNNQVLQAHDVLVVSSKITSFFEGRVVDLKTVEVSERASQARATEDCSPELVQLVLEEADDIIVDTKWVMLARNNGIYSANAGIDKRNVPVGHVVLWPKDPFASAQEIQQHFTNKKTSPLAVLIVDSICIPGRLGSVAVSIGYSGIQGYHDLSGQKDLFGTPYRYTGLNVVDSLATCANTVMGESTELIPLVIIRNAQWTPVKNQNRDEMIIPADEDMFPLTSEK